MSWTAEPVPGDPEPAGDAAGCWLHGVVREATPATLAAVTGMDGGPLRAVPAAGLVAVVSTAPLAEYGEEALRRNLEDLTWLERAARMHHEVVAALSRAGAVVPTRLATVYRDERGVARLLAERRAELAATLDRLTGRAEWGVKGYAVPGATARAAAGGGGAAPEGAGAAYLRRRRAELTARDEGQRAAAEAVHDALAGYAVAARRHAPQDRRLSGAPTAMVLNGAYLVDVPTLGGFTGLVAALAGRHPEVRLELTGPWPAYSFAEGRPPATAGASPPGLADGAAQ
ncbi:GvpL/GvpF family gas vesicle protein [Micromonospora sp. NBC_01655]|uniref:GvpL/GvpF family gas vesicle protein n=1 Tax=Micromonospora sp. NBC_01655 TaxID=2975983 RepID=UPI002251E751|nr:GvpL/GvpF family gas vesicle protein [Micromonospora sp. NBC_01655]MCX4469736.1 GvpL/GvpF family gas vesicle protein [Micromonospora sp. NBC_01655]